MSFPEQESPPHRQKSSELKPSETVFPLNVKTQDAKAEEKPPKKHKHKVPLTAAGVGFGAAAGWGGVVVTSSGPRHLLGWSWVGRRVWSGFPLEVMEKHQLFCKLNTSGQSERGLEKNFQTQSISEGGEFIKNKEQR